MVKQAIILVFGWLLSGTAFGDQDDWVYTPRQQPQQRQYRQQPEQRQYNRRDDYSNDYEQDRDRDRDRDFQDYQRNQGNQGFQGYRGGYRGYVPQPPTGYQAPADYYGLPPVRGFVYPPQPQQMPGFENHQRGRW
ncbi:hypothetical protein [Methylomonas sp. YC3]